MTAADTNSSLPCLLDRSALDRLFEVLRADGFRTVGPTVRDGAILYAEIESSADLPVGYTDEQEAGVYRLKKRNDDALFGYAVGPQAWKKFLHPPRRKLWSATREGGGFEIQPGTEDDSAYAFIGVRGCELHAIAIQDKVFMQGDYVDGGYKLRREKAFIVAVNCTQSAPTCFCTSMNTGPAAESGYDLALTELLNGEAHRFLIVIGSERGRAILEKIDKKTPADETSCQRAQALVEQTATKMQRQMDINGLKDLLYRNLENAHWDEIASRCQACANCTLVCPTCFCNTVEDVTDITGEHAERWQRWDSCFTTDFSYIHGGAVRPSTASRYRQWMTHKLASWIDQFDTSGCVGCGRCITWCPVGIDITEETAAFREKDVALKADQSHG